MKRPTKRQIINVLFSYRASEENQRYYSRKRRAVLLDIAAARGIFFCIACGAEVFLDTCNCGASPNARGTAVSAEELAKDGE